MASVLEFRLTGGSANSDPDSSLGGRMSSVELSNTAMNNLFDNVSPSEAQAGDTEYRMIDVYNSGDATAETVEIYVSSPTTSPSSTIHLGYDATNNSHDPNADLQTLSDESTAPTSPAMTIGEHIEASKLALPDINVGESVRVCVKRIISASATNTANDSGTIAVQYA